MKKALIIEKDSYTSETLAASLEYFEYEPIIYSHETELANQLIETNPYIVIVNLQLFTDFRHVFISLLGSKEKLFDACIILTSGDLIDPEIIRELGADFFLFKPYDINQLSDLLIKVEVTKCHSV